MIYTEFKSELINALSNLFDNSFEISIKTIIKNNQANEEALIIKEEGRNISPTIYLKPYYKLVEENRETIEHVADNIKCIYEDTRPTDDFNLSNIFDYESIKSNIVFKLISNSRNIDRLKNMPHRSYLDLAIIYDLQISASVLPIINPDDTGKGTISITYDLMKKWNLNESELFELASVNTPILNPPLVKSLKEFCENLMKLGSDDLLNNIDEYPPEMDAYILTNEHGFNGATSMLYKNQLKVLADIMNDDLIIIPSSIHEVIVFRKESDRSISDWNSIINFVNETELEERDILSDHLYFYNREDNIIC